MHNEKLTFQNLKIGFTIFLGLVVFFVLLFIIGNNDNLFTKSYKLNIELNNVEGLTTGSVVSVGGLKVGAIGDIHFSTERKENSIILELIINKRYQELITESSVASIKTMGLLGDKFIDISLGKKNEKILTEGSVVPVEASFQLEKLILKVENSMSDFSDILKNTKALTDTNKIRKGTIGNLLYNNETGNEISKLLKSLTEITNSVIKQKGTLGKMVYDNEIYSNLEATSNNLSEIISGLKRGKGTAGKLIVEDSLYINIKALSAKFSNLVDKLNSKNGTAGSLVNDNSTYNNLNKLIIELDALVKDINDNPKKYVKLSIF